MLKIPSKAGLKRFFVPRIHRTKGLLLGLLVLSGLALFWFISGFSQQEQGDSTRPELKFVRVKIGMRTPQDLEYLKGMGIECPKSGDCVVIITEAQRRQLEKKGLKAKALTGLYSDKGPNQVEYKLVKEIDLKADGVETIVFGPKIDRSSAQSEIILGVNEMDNKVCVYDSEFNLINKMDLRDITFSKNLRYLGGIRFVKIPQDVTEKGSYKFELFDYTGKKLWELARELDYDASPNGYSISSKGTVIERNHLGGILGFYDHGGKEIKKTQIYVGEWDPGGQGMRGEFSEDGEYLLIQAGDDYGHTFGEGIGVLFFTLDGKELWRFNTEDKGMAAASISRFNKYVAVSTRWSTYLLSREGNQIKKFSKLFATRLCFSSNEEYALITEYSRTLHLLKTENGEIIFKHTPSASAGSIYSTDIAQDAKMFGIVACYPGITKLRPEKEGNVEVLLIGFDGSKVWSDIFPSQEGPLFRMVNLLLSDDGKQMTIQIGSKIMIYQLVPFSDGNGIEKGKLNFTTHTNDFACNCRKGCYSVSEKSISKNL